MWQLLGISLRLSMQALALPAVLNPNSFLVGIVDPLRFNHILHLVHAPCTFLNEIPLAGPTVLDSQLPSINSFKQQNIFRYFGKTVFK